MHSALGYMGAGGVQYVQLAMITNAVLYSTFFVAGFFGGSVNVSLCPSSRKLRPHQLLESNVDP